MGPHGRRTSEQRIRLDRRDFLLKRLGPQNIQTLQDLEACEVVAAPYRRIHVPAFPQLRSLTTELDRRADDFGKLPRSAPIPRRPVEQAIVHSRELADDPRGAAASYSTATSTTGKRSPANANPGSRSARSRFYALVDAAGVREARARAWVLVRVAHRAMSAVNDESRSGAAELTRCVALAKAIQD